MAKEKSINPAQQQRKKEKDRAIKKAKQEQTNRRNERLSKRNPQRIQSQIDDLIALKESAGGKLSARDENTLQELERDLAGVKKARAALGIAEPKQQQHQNRDRHPHRGPPDRQQGYGQGRGQQQQQRRPPPQDEYESDTSATSSILEIPMPRDTPPPIPPHMLHLAIPPQGLNRGEIETRGPEEGQGQSHDLPPKPVQPAAQTVYEAKPQVRDLQKEIATSKFVPVALKKKGFTGATATTTTSAPTPAAASPDEQADAMEEDDPFKTLEEEERRFKEEIAAVPYQPAVEEVEDEEA